MKKIFFQLFFLIFGFIDWQQLWNDFLQKDFPKWEKIVEWKYDKLS